MYLGQSIKQVYPTTVAVGGSNMGQVPLFSVQWWANRATIPTGYVPADGQELPKSLYPDADAGIQANNVPLTTEATWQSTPTERGKWVATSSAGKFRVPDYNGKSVGSLGALMLRGDGTLSAEINGVIQRDAYQGHKLRTTGASGTSGAAGFAPEFGGDTTTMSGLGAYTALGTHYATYTGNHVTDGVNGTPRTAAETRPLNVTGCFIIKLFGAVTNAGSANAAQLATEYASLATQVQATKTFTDRFVNPGDAPLYACRAWVNFDGTTTPPTIRASGNVSSVVRNGTGDYTINFSTALPDANYSPVLGYGQTFAAANYKFCVQTTASEGNTPTLQTTTQLRVISGGANAAANNFGYLQVAIFR